jgi:hypothetical protein
LIGDFFNGPSKIEQGAEFTTSPLAPRVPFTEAVTPAELLERLTVFAVDVVRYCRKLRLQPEARKTN